MQFKHCVKTNILLDHWFLTEVQTSPMSSLIAGGQDTHHTHTAEVTPICTDIQYNLFAVCENYVLIILFHIVV